jgi:uncharacterized protein YjbJ (UPF0337 family)
MDKEHVKGAGDKLSGGAKEAAGKMSDNKKLEAEGKLDKAKGAACDFIGDVKDGARRADRDKGH